MDLEAFWDIIERSLIGHEGDPDDETPQAEALEGLLRELPRDELRAFGHIFFALRQRAYREDVWGAGYTLDEGMSDDSFSYFRDWLISRGRAVYEGVLADPDSLANVPGLIVGQSHNAELFGGAAFEVYFDRYGEDLDGRGGEPYDEMVRASISPAERARIDSPISSDADWEGDEERRYPRLLALINDQR